MEVVTEPSVTRKSKWLLVASASAAGLLLFTASLVLGAPQRRFFHRATNLSRAPTYQSGFVDVDVSRDGDRVAAVWAEAYTSGENKPPHGDVDLSWASESEGLVWTSRTIFNGSSSQCATRAAVAVTGTSPYTAHLAYVIQSPCGAPTNMEIRYQVCSLTYGVPCGSSMVMVARTLNVDEPGFRHVDIAVDSDNDPHLTYVYYITETGSLYYRSLSGGSLQPEEQPPYGVGRACNSPSIAWSMGRTHLVWEDETVREIHYQPYSETVGWLTQAPLDDYGSDTRPPRNPDIAARGTMLVAVWDMGHYCPGGSPLPACTEYTLAYLRSNNNGAGWFSGNWREVGSNLLAPGRQDKVYDSADGNGDSEDWPDPLLFLQPSVAMDGEGLPTVVWHANLNTLPDPDYDIWYTRAVSEADVDRYTWISPTLLSENTAGQQGSPVVAAANIISPFLHVVYAQRHHVTADWEAYYDVPTFQSQSGEYVKTWVPIIFRSFGDGG